jgi:hypothetical protein
MAIWSFYGHLLYFLDLMVIWYIFPVLVCCTRKKFGNPAPAKPGANPSIASYNASAV